MKLKIICKTSYSSILIFNAIQDVLKGKSDTSITLVDVGCIIGATNQLESRAFKTVSYEANFKGATAGIVFTKDNCRVRYERILDEISNERHWEITLEHLEDPVVTNQNTEENT